MTKVYLQNAVSELERSMDWTSGVIFGLNQVAEHFETDTQEYQNTIAEIEKLYKVQETSVRARMTLLEAIETLDEQE
jgi:hypothetical protein